MVSRPKKIGQFSLASCLALNKFSRKVRIVLVADVISSSSLYTYPCLSLIVLFLTLIITIVWPSISRGLLRSFFPHPYLCISRIQYLPMLLLRPDQTGNLNPHFFLSGLFDMVTSCLLMLTYLPTAYIEKYSLSCMTPFIGMFICSVWTALDLMKDLARKGSRWKMQFLLFSCGLSEKLIRLGFQPVCFYVFSFQL